MCVLGSQRHRKTVGWSSLGVLAALAGCYQDTPYPPCFVPNDPDPACHVGQDEAGTATATGTPTTGTAFPGDSSDSGFGEDTGSGETAASPGESSTGTTGPEEQAEPVIVGMSLTPGPGTPESCVLQSAGPVTVTVQTDSAMEVWIAVDDGEAVALEVVSDEGEFVGEIAVLGESWNGPHSVSAVAKSGELVSAPSFDMFTVSAPPAGSEAWLEKSALIPSYGNAVAIDAQGDVYELFTYSSNQGERCKLRRRDAQGVAVWADDARSIAPNVDCVGEDIKVGPDGSLWALINTSQNNAVRWELWHLDNEGVLLGLKPQVGSMTHVGTGLDVNAVGEVLVCGTRPGALDSDDAWVRYQPTVGDGWTVPWVFNAIPNVEADERTRDCAFVEDRIVVVGEAFGKLQQGEFLAQARGFVLELGRDSTKLAETIAAVGPAWQSGHEAVAPDGSGGYATVGYSCDSQVVPCAPTQGIVRWFSLGGAEIWSELVPKARRFADVALSPGEHLVVAAQAVKQEQGIIVQAWTAGVGTPLWEYQGAPSAMQVAYGVAVGPYAAVYGVGFYLEANDVLASGVVKLHPL